MLSSIFKLLHGCIGISISTSECHGMQQDTRLKSFRTYYLRCTVRACDIEIEVWERYEYISEKIAYGDNSRKAVKEFGFLKSLSRLLHSILKRNQFISCLRLMQKFDEYIDHGEVNIQLKSFYFFFENVQWFVQYQSNTA